MDKDVFSEIGELVEVDHVVDVDELGQSRSLAHRQQSIVVSVQGVEGGAHIELVVHVKLLTLLLYEEEGIGEGEDIGGDREIDLVLIGSEVIFFDLETQLCKGCNQLRLIEAVKAELNELVLVIDDICHECEVSLNIDWKVILGRKVDRKELVHVEQVTLLTLAD